MFGGCCQMFERETRREKIIDARHRELKLKERTKTTDKVSSVRLSLIRHRYRVADTPPLLPISCYSYCLCLCSVVPQQRGSWSSSGSTVVRA